MPKEPSDTRTQGSLDLTLPIHESSRLSIETSANLNDDLANDSDISGSFISHPASSHKRAESVLSFRNSIDADSSFLSSVLFQNFSSAVDELVPNSVSPLGPNSIYELTVASDLARAKRKATKTQVTLNGGVTTIYNVKNPTTTDIPQIHLAKLQKKATAAELDSVLAIDQEYKAFNSSYKSLTADTLLQFIQEEKHKPARSEISFDGSESHEDEIPAVFSDPNFRLDDPRIFKQVIGDCNILPDIDDYEGGSTKQNLANNNQLQEQLSHYLDLVEIQLIDEISKSSASFFSTIEDIKSVKTQSNECIQEFYDLKGKLEELEVNENKAGIKILNQIVERNNIEKLESAFIQIKYVTSIYELACQSFESGNNAKCLNEIILAESLIHGDATIDIPSDNLITLPKFKYPLLNLSRIPGLFDLQNDLQSLKNQCSRGYIIDFNDLLINDLKSHYLNVPITETLNRMYSNIDKTKRPAPKSVSKAYQNLEESTRTKLKDYVENLVKSGHLTASFLSYQDRIITEIKNIIKVHLPKSGLTDVSNAPSRASSVAPEPVGSETSQGTSLSSSIKSLTPKEFEDMLVSIFCQLSECLRRLTIHQKILLDLALSSIPPSDQVNVMVFDLTTAINKAIELTQLRLSKIINVRSEQIADLPVTYYARFYSLCSTYLQECELINPGYVASGAGSSLNDWVKNHVSYFVHRFHLNSLKSIAFEIDKEVWKETTDETLLSESQSKLDEVLRYSTQVEQGNRANPEWNKVLDLYDYEGEKHVDIQIEKDKTKLTINDSSFYVPKVVLSTVTRIRDYIMISNIFTNKLDTIENNLLNFFKLINTKTAHAILNAGATRTAGLKHITTKHLALCIQVVEFYSLFLIPVSAIFKNISKSVSPQPQQPHNINGDELTFSKVINIYKDHENELCSKLVSIMYDRTTSHCQSAVKIVWSDPLTHPRQCHPYMETLVRETSTVAKVLQKYLTEIKYSLILLQIFNNYKKLLVECFCTQLPQFKDFTEKHSLLKDIDYFRVKLCELPGYGNSGQVIWENVNALPTIEDTRMDEVMRHNIEGEGRKVSQELLRKSLDASRSSAELTVKTEENEKTQEIESQKVDLDKPEVVVDPKTESCNTEDSKTEVSIPEEPKAEDKKAEDSVPSSTESSELKTNEEALVLQAEVSPEGEEKKSVNVESNSPANNTTEQSPEEDVQIGSSPEPTEEKGESEAQ